MGEDKAGDSPFVTVGRLVRPAVVNIRIVRSVNAEGVGTGPLQEMYRQFYPDESGRGGKFESPSTGSGFVVDARGDVLTNHHVIAGADAVFVRFSGERREFRADVIGSDPNTDIALLRIKPGAETLPVLEFGDSDALEVGAWAIAVGNPFGNLESTLTVGVVSAKGRGDLQIGGRTPRYQDFIQTDASINHGNSGGPLVDIHGRVVGINTAIAEQGQGIGFAVPSNLARGIYAQLRDSGQVVRAYLGIWTEDVLVVAGEEKAGDNDGGVRVVKVAVGSPAALAGILPGDVILEFAGRRAGSNRQLQFQIAAAAPGLEVVVKLVRDGRPLSLKVVPSNLANQSADDGEVGPSADGLGMELAPMSGQDPRVLRLRDVLGVVATTGVMVVDVQEGGPAAVAGVRPGDVVVAVDGRGIGDMTDWELVCAEREGGHVEWTILIRTGGVETYVQIKPRRAGTEN